MEVSILEHSGQTHYGVRSDQFEAKKPASKGKQKDEYKVRHEPNYQDLTKTLKHYRRSRRNPIEARKRQGSRWQ